MKKGLSGELFRYGIVAIIAFVIDFGLLFVFTKYFKIYYLLSATLSFLISLIVNYFLSVKWAFRVQAEYSAVKIILFSIIAFLGLGLNDLIIWLATEKIGLFYLISKIIASLIVFFWNFLGRKILFKKTSEEKITNQICS